MNTVLPLYFYIIRAAVRDRLFWSVLGAMAIVISLSFLFGSSAVTEAPVFAITFAAFGLRLFGMVCLVLFTINYVRRCFEARDIDYLLSRPVSRIGFVMTHAAAFSTLALITAFILGGTVVAMINAPLSEGVVLWWVSMAAEFIIMSNIAMFFAFVMKSTTACSLIVFAFYLLSRLIGELLGILQVNQISKLHVLLMNVMEFISIFLPRLDLMGQTKWLLYGVPGNVSLAFIVGQGIIFSFLVICATAVDMKRRQF